jgi:hypothetical protein
MKRRAWIPGVTLLVGVGALVLSLTVNSETLIDYSMVKQFEFRESIRDVVFSLASDQDLEWLYPQVVVFRDSVRLFDERENLLAVLPFDYVSLGCCGSHVGVRTHESGPREKGELLPAQFTVYTRQGRPLWDCRYGVPDDGPSPGFIVSAASGAAAEIYAGLGEVVFHDSRGVELMRVDLFEGDEWSNARTAAGSFSVDGELFAIVAERESPVAARPHVPVHAGRLEGRIEEPRQLDSLRVAEIEPPPVAREEPVEDEVSPIPNLYLFVFDCEGNELWRRALDERHVGGRVVFSPDGNYLVVDALGIAVSPEDYADAIYLFDAGGDLVRKFSNLGALHVPWNSQLAFSGDGNVLGICANRRIKVARVADGETMWHKEYPWQVNTKEDRVVRCFEEVDLSRDGRLIVVASHEERRRSRGWGYASATVQLLGEGGAVLWEREYQDLVVAVRIASDGEVLAVATSRRVEIFRRALQ